MFININIWWRCDDKQNIAHLKTTNFYKIVINTFNKKYKKNIRVNNLLFVINSIFHIK